MPVVALVPIAGPCLLHFVAFDRLPNQKGCHLVTLQNTRVYVRRISAVDKRQQSVDTDDCLAVGRARDFRCFVYVWKSV